MSTEERVDINNLVDDQLALLRRLVIENQLDPINFPSDSSNFTFTVWWLSQYFKRKISFPFTPKIIENNRSCTTKHWTGLLLCPIFVWADLLAFIGLVIVI